jgi:uncharacterized membrane protein
VLAIVLTLLVLDLLPKGAESPTQLVEKWPTYLAYLAAFSSIGIVWLNHTQATSRIRVANPVVLTLNLGFLLGASLAPWPTALIADALQDGDRASQIGAIVVFALVTVIMSIFWFALDVYLATHPGLLRTKEDVAWMRKHAVASVGTVIGALVSVGLAFLSPVASLVLYVVVALAFVVTRLRESAGSETAEVDEA